MRSSDGDLQDRLMRSQQCSEVLPERIAALLAEGHSMVLDHDEPNAQRWRCSTCRCWVWDRRGSLPYGDALHSPCLAYSGRGAVHCSPHTGCGGTWYWPGTFANEQAARAWAREHATICRMPEVVVAAKPQRAS